MEGGLGAGSGLFIPPLPHPNSGHQRPSAEPRGARQLPQLTGTSLGDGAGLSWVSVNWGVGWARSPLSLGVAVAEGGCEEVRPVASIPHQDRPREASK